ncbi:acetoin utilization protein AcuC [Actinospica durhamensis]|uniref:Acetoin utilization protein AcuC n=1 Tax=Actinospica durhamensis TaxID=1508375 RepID=A0A941IU81_9ACTN|nr:acetoin utilization protein AcuC [Actinospica durhamensis]MBR7837073.1 acetoin utilization protein AcuC [Actinospica durhamensis]
MTTPDRAQLLVPWDESMLRYDFGSEHPLAPVRVELTMALARELGVLDAAGVRLVPVPSASDEDLELVHDREYIAAVRDVLQVDPVRLTRFGLGTPDNPVFARMHEAAALIAGASARAAEAVWTGEAEHAANMAGGLHHAMHDQASGFCVYNDPAYAIAHLLRLGAERVAYVDVDVHHGDGVQAAFYNDPRVLTISVHESPRSLFPGTGRPEESGGPDAVGMSVNLPLPAYTEDAAWLRAFDAVVPPLVKAFAPQVLVTQLGCDSHRLDPLAHLELSLDAQRAAVTALHRLAHEHADGRWLLLGGGGYALVEVVPRIWTSALAEAAHRPLPADTPTPEAWRAQVARRTGAAAPELIGDGAAADFRRWVEGYDPANEVDRAIMATRKAVFPEHGLDPQP